MSEYMDEAAEVRSCGGLLRTLQRKENEVGPRAGRWRRVSVYLFSWTP